MDNSYELKERFLSKDKQQGLSPEEDTLKWIDDLFQPEKIKDNESSQMLERAKGYVGIESILQTNLKTGITTSERDLQWRGAKFGRNNPIVKTPKTLWEMVLENFEDRTIQILCFAAVASLALGIATHGIQQGWLEGVSILLAVTIIAAVTSWNNYMKEKQFRKLNEVANRKNVNVTRNGSVINMSVYDLLVGDIVQVQTGEILSVDGIVFKANKLFTNESSMTGEGKDIAKFDFQPKVNRDSFLLSGSKVVAGTGMMIVMAVGFKSAEGKLRARTQEKSDMTPLQIKLGDLADQIGILGMYSAGFTFIALLVHLLYSVALGERQLFSIATVNTLVEYFIISVTIVVIAVPEGLPLAVTISLAYSVSKMKDENNLVRFLAACETMGGANNICTDKTGTLTKNQMTVTNCWTELKTISKFAAADKSILPNTRNLLCLNSCINSDAHPKVKTQGDFEQIGNKTQCALIEMAYNMGFDFRTVRTENKILNSSPFSSATKKMSTIVCTSTKKYYIFSKGAPDVLLSSCSHYLNNKGEVVAMDAAFGSQLSSIISNFSSQCLRTLLLAHKELDEQQVTEKDPEKLVNNLVITTLVGIKDPLKDSISQAVTNCKKAGIIVRMVTGDFTETAQAIAKQARIIPASYERPPKGKPGYYVVMEGKQFRTAVEGLIRVKKSKEQKRDGEEEDKENKEDTIEVVKNIKVFTEITRELRVLARSSPEDKYLLAAGLKQLENVVAMTGDGVNDAPALKKADIGFAMGIAGSQIAKEASGIILLDDNFGSIITAVKYGRNIFDCIRKFLQFQLTVNVVAIFMAFLGAVVVKESPLMPVQMLWVNLIMDTLAALALATEPPSNELLTRMPYSRNEAMITPHMWRAIAMNGLFQIIVLSVILFEGDEIFDIPSSIGMTIETWNAETGIHLTIFFDVFVFLQVFNFFNARKLKHSDLNVFEDVANNYLFVLIVAGIFLCQLFIVQFGGKAFWLVPLSIQHHLQCIAIGSLSLVSGLFMKKCIPESLYNGFALTRAENRQEFYDVDSIFKDQKV